MKSRYDVLCPPGVPWFVGRILAGIVLTSILGNPGRAGQTAALPYSKLVAGETAFETIPRADRDKLLLQVQVVHGDPADRTPIHLWVETGGQRMDIPLDADGVVSQGLQQDWVTQNLNVESDQPRGSLQLHFNLVIQPPGDSTFPLGYLRDALQQAQSAARLSAREMGGFFAQFIVPSFRSVTLKLARCCGETLRLDSGGEQVELKQNADGVVALPAGWLERKDATATSSAPVTLVEPTTD